MSTLQVNTLQDTSGNEKFTATAWVNFNGTGTVAIRDSGNVSSITDNSTGDYTVNFSTAMDNSDYAAVVGYQYASGTSSGRVLTYTTTSVRALFNDTASVDADPVSLIVVGGR